VGAWPSHLSDMDKDVAKVGHPHMEQPHCNRSAPQMQQRQPSLGKCV